MKWCRGRVVYRAMPADTSVLKSGQHLLSIPVKKMHHLTFHALLRLLCFVL